jgi:transmembrane sensor
METESERARIAEAAARWVARRDRGFTREEEVAFAVWKNADSRHAAEWERLLATWHGLDALGGVEQLEAMADRVVDRARSQRTRARRFRLVWSGLAAAAAIAIAVVGWRELRGVPRGEERPASDSYRVLTSTLQRLPLPDGTIAELNGASRIEVEYTPAERRVRMIEGEVHFVVAKMPERPFVVVVDGVSVKAVGTAFNVRVAGGRIEVLVTEGNVKLDPVAPGLTGGASASASSQPLGEGQRAVIVQTGPAVAPEVEISTINRTQIREALDWQSTRLVFEDTPLDQAIAGFNRYNQHQLTLGDAALSKRRLSGTFRSDNLDGFLRVVRFTVDVKAEKRTQHETVLLPIR